MLAKILLSPYGSFWNLKNKAQNSSGFMRKVHVGVYRSYLYENSADISMDSLFSSEPCLPHDIRGVFISGGAKIGKNAIIFQQVTIGSVTLPDSKGAGAPTIGDNCYIGAGAKIVGNVKVGDNVRIGANATVYKDVPDNTVVISGEQKNITKSTPMLNHYYTNDDGVWSYFQDGKWIKESDESIISKLRDDC